MKTGDVVYLNSGSPPLTVVTVGEQTDLETRLVTVTWHSADLVLRTHSFPEACLQKEKPAL